MGYTWVHSKNALLTTGFDLFTQLLSINKETAQSLFNFHGRRRAGTLSSHEDHSIVETTGEQVGASVHRRGFVNPLNELMAYTATPAKGSTSMRIKALSEDRGGLVLNLHISLLLSASS